ncbi:response regulator transcription factor [Mastigocladus laminosus UU774]|nr:response regulator transcription factor [Mastigocladus laminosus UU774]
MNNETIIRILIADDHPIVLQGLSALVGQQPGMIVVAEARNGREAVELFGIHHPDVALLDLQMPELTGVEAIQSIKSEFPQARIIILTTYDTDEDIYQGLKAGAKAYLLKDAPTAELLNAIRTVHRGQKYIAVEVGAKLAARMEGPQLSEREREVLTHLVKGMSNQQISKALSISDGTVKFHVNHILSKLGVSDRTQAVIEALKRGLVSLK